MRLLRYMTKWLCVLIRLQYHCGLKEQGIHMARWLGGYGAMQLHDPGGYSRFQVTGMIEGFFGGLKFLILGIFWERKF